MDKIKPNTIGVILAAGEGTRMNSRLPKVLHRCFGEPLITHVERTLLKAGLERIIAVVGHKKEAVRAVLSDRTETVEQTDQLGTGDALQSVMDAVDIPDEARLLVTCGDIPGVTPERYIKLLADYQKADAELALLVARLDDPAGYGRVIGDQNSIHKIVEEKDATSKEKLISAVNSGIICGSAKIFKNQLPRLSRENQSGEYYLTDVVKLLTDAGKQVLPVKLENSWEISGINTRRQLVEFEQEWYRKIRAQLFDRGITAHDPELVKIGPWVEIGPDVVLENSVTIHGDSRIGPGTRITGPTTIYNTTTGSNNLIIRSRLANALFGDRVRIGPFCHVRPGTRTGNDVRLGNFVETKMTEIGNQTNISHLSYIGDSTVGNNVNIGAGTITCNYDGYAKHKTVIGDAVFVGSNCELVAPIKIETGAMIGAGSTITKNIPADSLGLTRSEQKIKHEWVTERWKPRKEEETDSD